MQLHSRARSDGSLESTQTTDFGSTADIPVAVVLTPEGKVTVVGHTSGVTNDFALARYNPDNSLDGSFGTGGKVITDFTGPLNDEANSVTVLPDGNLLVAGSSLSGSTLDGSPPGYQLLLMRFSPTGVPDSTFGTNGRVTVPDLNGPAVFVQPDGRIVVAGGARGGALVMTRFHVDGRLDTDFGTNGRASILISDRADDYYKTRATAIQRLADGRLLVAGACSNLGVAARFSAAGVADMSYGRQGRLGSCGSESSSQTQSVIQADGKVVIHDRTVTGGKPIIITGSFTRYDVDGREDRTFQPGELGITSGLFALRTLPDGRLLLGETSYGIARITLTRLLPNGTLDVSFGSGGRSVRDFDPPPAFESLVGAGLIVQPDGSVLVTGNYRRNESTVEGAVLLTRFAANGQVTFSFGVGGMLRPGFHSGPLSALALQPDGKLLAAGWATGTDGTHDLFVTRFTLTDTFTTTNQRYVGQLYRQLLDRPAEPAGLAAFSGLLDSGKATRAQVADVILASMEYRQMTVRRLYRSLLDRDADAAGLEGFSQFLASGGTVAQVKAIMLGSAEYLQQNNDYSDHFLNALYRDVLGREIDPTGLEGYKALLAAGRSRAAVAAQVLASRESLEYITRSLYRAHLRRDAEQGGLVAVAEFLQTGGKEDAVRSVIFGSAEFLAGL